MVAAAEGCLLCRLYSAANGENMKLKWLAKPAEEVKSAECPRQDVWIKEWEI